MKNNLENAKASLEVLVADLQFLRDQVTVTQVQRYFYVFISLDLSKGFGFTLLIGEFYSVHPWSVDT